MDTLGNLVIAGAVGVCIGWLIRRAWQRWNPDTPPSEDKRRPPPNLPLT